MSDNLTDVLVGPFDPWSFVRRWKGVRKAGIRMPGSQKPRPTILFSQDDSPAAPATSAPDKVAALAGKRVLICEDEGISQMQLRRALARSGMLVVGAASNGRMAVDLAIATRPDLILMDIRMPVMDGIEAARLIKGQIETCVVMLTAFSDDEYRREAAEAGAAGFIVKPVTGDTLVPALEKIWTDLEARG